jgi:hypothetical protein
MGVMSFWFDPLKVGERHTERHTVAWMLKDKRGQPWTMLTRT